MPESSPARTARRPRVNGGRLAIAAALLAAAPATRAIAQQPAAVVAYPAAASGGDRYAVAQAPTLPAPNPTNGTPAPTETVAPPLPDLPPIPQSYAELLAPPPGPSTPLPAATVRAATSPTFDAPPIEPSPVESAPAIEPVTPIGAELPTELALGAADAIATGPLSGPPTDGSLAGDDGEPIGPVLDQAVPWYYPSYWFGPAPWDSGVELGLNGASGTSESLSFRTGGFVKREQDDYKFDGSLYYNKTQSEGIEIQSNALLDVRYDWLFDDSPWTLFILSQTFYDEFQAFDLNFNLNAGFGYRWLDSDRQKLTTSVGTGASREFGGLVRDEWVAEASFGVNYELQVADNKKFYAKADWFPEWEDFGSYRVLADVGLEIELHQPSNLSLKLSATDRYDSEPDGVEPHNLNYSALLILKL